MHPILGRSAATAAFMIAFSLIVFSMIVFSIIVFSMIVFSRSGRAIAQPDDARAIGRGRDQLQADRADLVEDPRPGRPHVGADPEPELVDQAGGGACVW